MLATRDSLCTPAIQRQTKRTLIRILSWYLTSMGLSVYNRWLFSSHGFVYPLFVTTIHNMMQVVLSLLALQFLYPHLKPSRFPKVRDYLLKVVPCGLATGLDIGLSNNSLKYITLSLYTMVKSSAPLFVLLFAFLFRLEKPTFKLCGVMLIIFVGVLCMVAESTHYHLIGYLQVQAATIASGFRWALTQILLEKESLGMSNPLATNLFLSPLMAASLFVASVSLEGLGNIFSSEFFLTFASTFKITVIILLGGILAFLMLIAEFLLISETSVVTFSVAGVCKEVLTIILSAIVFGDTFTSLNIVGLVISITGLLMYNYIRIQKMLADKSVNQEYYRIDLPHSSSEDVFVLDDSL